MFFALLGLILGLISIRTTSTLVIAVAAAQIPVMFVVVNISSNETSNVYSFLMAALFFDLCLLIRLLVFHDDPSAPDEQGTAVKWEKLADGAIRGHGNATG